jgi:mannose-6-phosphate isomerase-like protein (cupin superfamily)
MDYLLLEKTDNISLAELPTTFFDLGNWERIFELCSKDEVGNSVHGDVILNNVTSSYICANGCKIVASNLDSHVVVGEAGKVLIKKCPPEEIAKKWGTYRYLTVSDKYRVKMITIRPNCATSLQFHVFRDELCLVVNGVAEVSVGDNTRLVEQGGFFHVPKNEKHKISNIHQANHLDIIEIQYGEHISEDDIVRLDNYAAESVDI